MRVFQDQRRIIFLSLFSLVGISECLPRVILIRFCFSLINEEEPDQPLDLLLKGTVVSPLPNCMFYSVHWSAPRRKHDLHATIKPPSTALKKCNLQSTTRRGRGSRQLTHYDTRRFNLLQLNKERRTDTLQCKLLSKNSKAYAENNMTTDC